MRDGADDAPLDLGVVGSGGDPETDGAGGPAHGPSRAWWTWAVPVVTLLVGGLLGAVVADARHDAAELARVGIVSGSTSWTPSGAEDGSTTVDLQLMNIGARPVEIVGIAADGFTITPGTDAAEAVEAPVGEWVAAQQNGLVADCEAAAPTNVRVNVRDDSGDERIVVADHDLQHGGLDMLWTSQCEVGGGYVQLAGPVSTVLGESSVTATMALVNRSGRAVQVTHLVPYAPGLTATPPNLPISLPGHGTAQVELTWTVADCAAALSMPGDAGRVEYTFASGTIEVPSTSPLDVATMVELVRLTGRVCG